MWIQVKQGYEGGSNPPYLINLDRVQYAFRKSYRHKESGYFPECIHWYFGGMGDDYIVSEFDEKAWNLVCSLCKNNQEVS
jgi:hypothetical protein